MELATEWSGCMMKAALLACAVAMAIATTVSF